ncbi:adenylyl-sulfate reductase subunit alpha [Candidatus Marsarchaeota G2 archaeon ECH_B_SAG-C16]|uniref:Adenylyl-sulfate reductase subunit alpha n=1 Tax=Candidatus Marsarchaeota G2 archaeon ECH_B_SAG-C16 TaxID=1978163 RepID=A0A2R6BD76_9ARCH|nr:MAG: adenylyl-sulfate reductase subunit alpha [Candidatus Marsarchaeota G2 archaeon ECH_B_SAG-C16]
MSVRSSRSVHRVDCDILIIGGGMAGCGAAYEARYWGRRMKIVLVEKANIERSGAVAMGLSAINCYMGMRWNENRPEDFVRYARGDLMGLVREDLLFDIARHVDSTVHLFEEWGLPIIYDKQTGHYKREGRWQILIHGESYKPIVAEAAQKAASEVYNRIMVTHLLLDRNVPNRVAGAVGFSVRDGSFYVFRAKAVIVGAGGATHIFRPRSVGEGAGRTWYAPWSTGSAYGLLIQVGAEMTQMENRLVVTRFKDGYGPVGAWFLALKAVAKNAYGEEYERKYVEEQRKLYGDYVDSKPFPTCLRNDAMFREIKAGRHPIYLHTEQVLDTPEKEELGWEDFLDMTMSQSIVWASQNIDPKKRPSELTMSEPYIMGSHATCSGAWASGPEDVSPRDYYWGYNRMTTVEGLFGAGDTIGGSAHKFSSGSFTEGRLAAKAAVKYVLDHPDYTPEVDPTEVEALRERVYQPLETYETGRNMIVKGTVSPIYLYPNQGVVRLEKIMDEYAAGYGSMYMTNEFLLNRGLELLIMLKEDLERLAAENLHQLQRAWELHHRVWTAEAVIRHTLYRKETRWPGYYYRSDYPKLDDQNWHVFVNSRYDPKTREWVMSTRPVHHIVG